MTDDIPKSREIYSAVSGARGAKRQYLLQVRLDVFDYLQQIATQLVAEIGKGD